MIKKRIKKIIPNILTFINLISGCISIIFILQNNNLIYSFYFTILSILFDFLDGFLSRKMKVETEFGKRLDSVSDMVSFGIVPTMIIFSSLKEIYINSYMKWISLFIPIFSAYRLSNTEKNDKTYGLTTPINTLFFSIFFILFFKKKNPLIIYLMCNPVIVISLILFFCYLLISRIEMFSFKFTGISWTNNKSIYIFLLVSLWLLYTSKVVAFLLIIIYYIILSIYNYIKKKLLR